MYHYALLRASVINSHEISLTQKGQIGRVSAATEEVLELWKYFLMLLERL